MKTEEIKLLRKNYYSLVKENQELQTLKKRISELEQTNEVKEYLDLINKLNSNYHVEVKSDHNFVRKAINFSNITPTNDIYVYIGTYKYDNEVDVVHDSVDYLVSRNDHTADYVVYYNLEAKRYNLNFSIKIPYEKAGEFESKYNVIFSERFDKEAYFYDLQDEYFTTVILESEEKAMSKIKKLVKKNNRV